MKVILFAILFFSSAYAAETIEGHQFVTKAEYHNLGKPCACPTDTAKNGKCGRRAAICKTGGYNILDCIGISIKSIQDYKKVQKELCNNDF